MSEKPPEKPALGPSAAVVEEFLNRVRLDETLSPSVETSLEELAHSGGLTDSAALQAHIIESGRADDETYKP